jgi:hypothetical protein
VKGRRNASRSISRPHATGKEIESACPGSGIRSENAIVIVIATGNAKGSGSENGNGNVNANAIGIGIETATETGSTSGISIATDVAQVRAAPIR